MSHQYQTLSQTLSDFQQFPTIELAQTAIQQMVEFLGVQLLGWELCLYPQIAGLSFVEKAPGYADKKAVYEYADAIKGCEVRLFCVNKFKKSMITKGVALTDNFEDGRAMFNKPVGVDFFADMKSGEIIMVVSKEHQLRTMTLRGGIRNTQKIIFDKWSSRDNLTGSTKEDMNIKSRNHKIIRESLSLKELNKQFYVGDKKNPGIISFFTELKQHLLTHHQSGMIVFHDKDASQFVARMFGRIIFCEFLRKKGLINESYGYYDYQNIPASEYYSKRLQVLFFEVLNKEISERTIFIGEHKDEGTPFLNGGLFDAKENDHYQEGNTILFPDDYFIRLFSFLEEYNFTTDESSTDYQQVAIDPEMLGRIFENLLAEQSTETGEQARKAKGAFYTPREIVDYMCRESIRQYLKNACKELIRADEAIDKLIDTKDHAWDKNIVADIKDYKTNILTALDGLTILDPACGSGAYPMGIVQLMTKLYERLDPTKDPYKVKLKIIKDTIFGVDIEPMAIEISRLRAWLALIVDEELQPQSPNLGIDPLPNLDFKFVCANSLIGLEQETHSGRGAEVVNKLSEIREKYFDPKNNKKSLQRQYEKIITEQKHSFGYITSQALQQLVDFNPFDVAGSAGFFDSQFMFGVDGFDLVIGNPPYVGEKGNKTTFDPIKPSLLGKRFYQGKMDLFYFFFHLGLDCLKDKGVLAFITTNYFITATGGLKLRTDIRERSDILRLINFGELKIFESALGQHNMITMLSKGKHNKLSETIVTNRKGYLGDGINNDILNKKDNETKYYTLTQGELYSRENIKLTSGGLDDLLDKVMTSFKKLDYYCNVYKGITTGRDSIYIKNEEDIKDTNNEDIKYIKKRYKNSNIQRYTHTESDQRVLYLTKYTTDIGGMSFIKRELEKNKEILMNRKDANLKGNLLKGYYWVLATPRMEIPFEKEKIIVPQRSKINTFGYSDHEFYASGDVYFITQPKENYTLKFLLGILNSHLIYIWLYNRGKRKGEMLELYQEPLSQIPIPKITPENQDKVQQVETIVNQILEMKKSDPQADTSGLEAQIDQLVYELYELTDEEIAIVEGSRK